MSRGPRFDERWLEYWDEEPYLFVFLIVEAATGRSHRGRDILLLFVCMRSKD